MVTNPDLLQNASDSSISSRSQMCLSKCLIERVVLLILLESWKNWALWFTTRKPDIFLRDNQSILDSLFYSTLFSTLFRSDFSRYHIYYSLPPFLKACLGGRLRNLTSEGNQVTDYFKLLIRCELEIKEKLVQILVFNVTERVVFLLKKEKNVFLKTNFIINYNKQRKSASLIIK